MSALATILWALDLLFDTGGHLALKYASRRASLVSRLPFWRAILSQSVLWLAILAFVGEFLAFLSFLALVPLSKAALLGCFNILMVMIGGRIFFNERVTPTRAGAALLIGAGVALVGWAGP